MSRRKPDTPEIAMFPRVVPEHYQGSLKVAGEYRHTKFEPGKQYTYIVSSMRWRADSTRKKSGIAGTATAQADGSLSIPFSPDIHGEWIVTIDAEDGHRHLPAELGAFVMKKKYYELRPFIGELHCHSTGSDGREEPIYTAIRGRQLGYDFFALTDHRNYQTSAEMVKKAGAFLGGSMLLMHGEEMHHEVSDDESDPARSHLYHFVAAGHRNSVRDLYLSGGDRTQAEVSAIIHELEVRDTIPGLDYRSCADSIWKLRKANELGGMTIFCHPYWAWSLNIDEVDREQTFLDAEFDAVEVFSTADPSNIMTNRYLSAVAAGADYAAVGVSDGHRWGPGTTMRQCTFVLAEELSTEKIVDAVKNQRSIACEETQANDQIPRLVGPLEFIDFAEYYFLRILPLKRRIMAMGAEIGFSGLRGGAFSKELIDELDQNLKELENDLWA